MVFIPTVTYVPTPPTQASLEAQELARDIEDAIVRYQDEHPSVRQQDVQQALQLARSRAGAGSGRRQEIVVALIVGLTLLAGLGTLFFFLR